jgi:hypothetical protein
VEHDTLPALRMHMWLYALLLLRRPIGPQSDEDAARAALVAPLSKECTNPPGRGATIWRHVDSPAEFSGRGMTGQSRWPHSASNGMMLRRSCEQTETGAFEEVTDGHCRLLSPKGYDP